MAIAEPPKAKRPLRSLPNPQKSNLGVSAYDQVAGMLVAMLVIAGSVTGTMFLIWVSSKNWWPTTSLPVMVLEDVGGGGSGDGTGQEPQPQFEEPAPEELPEAAPPKAEDIVDAISTLEVSSQALEPELSVVETASSTFGKGKGRGRGDGEGDGEGPGTKKGIPSWERWEVRLNANQDSDYAQQLDFFKIELAVAGGGSPVVTYVTNVSGTPKVRTGDPKLENRLRFMHRTGALREADRRLVGKAGVNASGKVVFQFYSKETYDLLLKLENIHMGQRSISQVRRTVFGVRGAAGKYEFHVISQDYIN